MLIPWHTRDPNGSRPTAPIGELESRLAESEERARQLELKLRQARRLETVGRLVAGVAHDFNNLLTIITGNAELVRDRLPADDPMRDPADLIVTTALTAAGVSRQLLGLARPTPGEVVPVDMNAAVRAVARILRRLVGDRVKLDMLLTASLHPIRIDPGQLDQLLLNLVVNARDAIADAGTITVRTAEASVTARRPGWPADRPPGEYVVLTVSDTGCGMTDEVKARIFEEFFTTKGEAGTGLGLTTVRDIVRAAGGHIEIESAPDWGTTARVYWPRATEAVPTAGPRSRPPVVSHGETVLLVQDGPPLRDIATLALQHAGYRVLEAPDSVAAEERSRLYAGPIHLLVADAGPSESGGLELMRKLRTTRPELKVLLVAGSPPTGETAAPFLLNPAGQNELLEAVRRALDT